MKNLRLVSLHLKEMIDENETLFTHWKLKELTSTGLKNLSDEVTTMKGEILNCMIHLRRRRNFPLFKNINSKHIHIF